MLLNPNQKYIDISAGYSSLMEWAKTDIETFKKAVFAEAIRDCEIAYLKIDVTAFKVELDISEHELFDDCYRDALKYPTLSAWKVGAKNSFKKRLYGKALNKGWVNIMTTHMMKPNTKKHAQNCLSEAIKYKSINEWRALNLKTYTRVAGSVHFKLCKTITKPIYVTTWTKSKLFQSVVKFSSSRDWRLTESNTYTVAVTNGWLEEINFLMGWNQKITFEECLLSAKKHKTKVSWLASEQKFYNTAYQKGWVGECCAHMVCAPRTTTKSFNASEVIALAKQFDNLRNWSLNHPDSYSIAKKNPELFEECSLLFIKEHKEWNYENCKKEALKFRSVNDWKIHSGASYTTSSANGWLNEFSQGMARKNRIWTLAECIQHASKYTTKSKWSAGHQKTYLKARKQKWIAYCADSLGKELSKEQSECLANKFTVDDDKSKKIEGTNMHSNLNYIKR